jgi:homoserine O-acetyltransferase
VGTGKIADSSKFFVVTVDALGNGISTSPSNGQKPFPNITIKDMVNSQHELLTRKLGIGHVHAVMGISMGGMQTFEWMVAYPGFMTHAVPIIGSPKLASPDLLLWQAQLSAIESAKDSREGMKAVMAMHNYALQTPEWRAQNTPSADWAKFKTQFEGDAGQRMTPEDWASQLRAMMSTDVTAAHGGSWDAAARAVHADALVVVATQDHMVNPGPALEFARLLGAAVVKLEGNCGHMATGCEAEKFETAVRIFLGQR